MGHVIIETPFSFFASLFESVLDPECRCIQMTLSLGVDETWLRMKCIKSMEDSRPETIPQDLDIRKYCIKLPRVPSEACMILVKKVTRTLENGSDGKMEVFVCDGRFCQEDSRRQRLLKSGLQGQTVARGKPLVNKKHSSREEFVITQWAKRSFCLIDWKLNAKSCVESANSIVGASGVGVLLCCSNCRNNKWSQGWLDSERAGVRVSVTLQEFVIIQWQSSRACNKTCRYLIKWKLNSIECTKLYGGHWRSSGSCGCVFSYNKWLLHYILSSAPEYQ